MKKKVMLDVVFALLCAIAIEIVSIMWREGFLIEPQLQSKYYIGAILILLFGIAALLSLYNLKKEVRQMNIKHKQNWNSILQFVFILNCIGLPLYLISFLVNRYLQS